MAKIIINTESFANEQTLTEIKAAASQASPTNSADVIRDSNGKVAKVVINLPDNTSAEGLMNARNQISENHGVATAVSFPILSNGGLANSFDSATPGNLLDIGSLIPGFGEVPARVSETLSWGLPSLSYAYATESVGGSGSALMADPVMQPGPTPDNATSFTGFKVNSSELGLSRISEARITCKIRYSNKRNNISTSPVGTSSDAASVQFAQNGPSVIAPQTSPAPYVNGKWFIFDPTAWPVQHINTGLSVDRNSFIDVSFQLLPDGKVEIKVGSYTYVTVGQVFGFPAIWDGIFNIVSQQVGFGGLGTSYVPSPLIVDDIKIEILNGNV